MAESNPDVASSAFINVLKYEASPPIRALALQGIAKIAPVLTKQDLASGESEYSLALLQCLSSEVAGTKQPTGDLTLWAVAWAIEQLGFSPDKMEHWMGGTTLDILRRIRHQIIHKKLEEINNIHRFDGTGQFTPAYETYLEFWLYGPTEELLRAHIYSSKYIGVVKDVLNSLQVRGIEIALDSPNRIVQKEALFLAQEIFLESWETQQKLYHSLKYFLLEDYYDDVYLRQLAAEPISKAGSWLDISQVAKAAIICQNWQQVIAIGEPSVATLEKAIAGNILLADISNDREIINCQIKAVETIGKIKFAHLTTKLQVLSKILLHPEEEVRNAAVILLIPHRSQLSRLEKDASNLLQAILFEYQLNKPELRDLTIPEMEKLISEADKYQWSISTIFSRAIASADSLANRYEISPYQVKQFLQAKFQGYLPDIGNWMETISTQISETLVDRRNIQLNRYLINQAFSAIYKLDFHLYNKLIVLPNEELRISRQEESNSSPDIEAKLIILKNRILLELHSAITQLDRNRKKRLKKYQKIGMITIILLMVSGLFAIKAKILFVFYLVTFLVLLFMTALGAIVYVILEVPQNKKFKNIEQICQELSNNYGSNNYG